MAATRLLAELEDMVECPVCLEQFKEPRSLPCQHSFCTECLQGLLGMGRKIKCPCCKKEARVPNGVRQLPVDFRANTLLETVSKFQNTEDGGSLGAEAAHENVQPTCRNNKLDKTCPVCEQPLVISNNKKLICGHRVCGNCVTFLQPVVGVSLHCPTCSSETMMPSQLSTNPGTSTRYNQPEIPLQQQQLQQQPASNSLPPNLRFGTLRFATASPSAPPLRLGTDSSPDPTLRFGTLRFSTGGSPRPTLRFGTASPPRPTFTFGTDSSPHPTLTFGTDKSPRPTLRLGTASPPDPTLMFATASSPNPTLSFATASPPDPTLSSATASPPDPSLSFGTLRFGTASPLAPTLRFGTASPPDPTLRFGTVRFNTDNYPHPTDKKSK